MKTKPSSDAFTPAPCACTLRFVSSGLLWPPPVSHLAQHRGPGVPFRVASKTALGPLGHPSHGPWPSSRSASCTLHDLRTFFNTFTFSVCQRCTRGGREGGKGGEIGGGREGVGGFVDGGPDAGSCPPQGSDACRHCTQPICGGRGQGGRENLVELMCARKQFPGLLSGTTGLCLAGLTNLSTGTLWKLHCFFPVPGMDGWTRQMKGRKPACNSAAQ